MYYAMYVVEAMETSDALQTWMQTVLKEVLKTADRYDVLLYLVYEVFYAVRLTESAMSHSFVFIAHCKALCKLRRDTSWSLPVWSI